MDTSVEYSKTKVKQKLNKRRGKGMANILGVDLGYVQTKAVGENWLGIFPSIVKPRSEVVLTGLDDSEGYLITGESGTWNVGAKGTYDFKAERLQKDSDLPKLLTALGLYEEGTGRTRIDLLVSGLPVDDFKAGYAEVFGRRLKGMFAFGFGHKAKHIYVADSLVLPQSAGAFFDFTLTSEGEENTYNADLASEDVLILDIGGKSTDGCIMEQALFSQDSFTLWQGVWKVHEELRKLIMRAYKYNVAPYKLDEVLKTGAIRLGGDIIPVMDLVKKAVNTVFPTLRDELTLYVPDFRRFAAILLCGGGAYIYHELIADTAGIPVIVLDNAEYANASGYRKYGLLKSIEGLV
jgi:hypothetical protein